MVISYPPLLFEVTFRNDDPHLFTDDKKLFQNGAKKMSLVTYYKILQDNDLQEEVDKILKRSRTSVSYIGRKTLLDLPSVVRYNSLENRSPRVDYELCKAVFSSLRSQLLLTSQNFHGGTAHISLEVVLRRRRKLTKKNLSVPLKQQLELALLWYASFP